MKRIFLGIVCAIYSISLEGCNEVMQSEIQKVPIEDKLQHILIEGEGSPTVVFITGAGSDLEDFAPVQKEISSVTKTFSYDKPGIGKSEIIDSPRTIENMTSELMTLLKKLEIENEVLLVGHSLGGFVARDFAAKHLDKTIGMVLIDPGNEYLTERVLLTFPVEERSRLDSLIHTPDPASSFGFQAEIASRRSWDSYMRKNEVPSSIPVVLIESVRINEAALLSEKVVKIKQELNRDLQSRIPNIKFISTKESGHFIQLDEPELVVKAILELLKEVN